MFSVVRTLLSLSLIVRNLGYESTRFITTIAHVLVVTGNYIITQVGGSVVVVVLGTECWCREPELVNEPLARPKMRL